MIYPLYLESINLMAIAMHVYVSRVGRPNVGGFPKHTYIVKYIHYGNVG